MKKFILILVLIASLASPARAFPSRFFEADHPYLQYTGRIDFSNLKAPRFWAAGVYIEARFSGTFCEVEVRDEVLWGTSHNYIEVSIDGSEPIRIKLTDKINRITVADNLTEAEHTIIITKGTEALIGYLEFIGLRCKTLLPVKKKSTRKIEFIGDSITSGMANYTKEIPCDSGVWYDQHSAWYSYGAISARELNADYAITSESGIGLIYSCCNKKLTMPEIYDNISISQDSIAWDFSRFQPDVVTVCLGQNDGIQDSLSFTSAYVKFIQSLRNHYPKAKLVCLTSPMADDKLRPVLTRYIQGVVEHCRAGGEKNLSAYYFTRQYKNGCGSHPDVEDDKQIAAELTTWLRKEMNWR
jgi:lysophospholipase L1-like esterase